MSATDKRPSVSWKHQMAVCQNLVPLVNIKIAGKRMFIPLNMVLIGIDPYPDDTRSGWIRMVSRISLHGEQSVNRNSICCESPFVTGAFGGQIEVKPCGNIC